MARALACDVESVQEVAVYLLPVAGVGLPALRLPLGRGCTVRMIGSRAPGRSPSPAGLRPDAMMHPSVAHEDVVGNVDRTGFLVNGSARCSR